MLLYASLFEVSAARLSFPALSCLPLTTCVIKHCAVHPIEWPYWCLIPKPDTAPHWQRYGSLLVQLVCKIHFVSPSQVQSAPGHFSSCQRRLSLFIKGRCRGTFGHRRQEDSSVWLKGTKMFCVVVIFSKAFVCVTVCVCMDAHVCIL